MEFDDDTRVIKNMIKGSDNLPQVWARLMVAKMETLQEKLRRLEGENEKKNL